MMNEIYEGLAARTGGKINIAVAGPAGAGKSAFVRWFSETAFPQRASLSEENGCDSASCAGENGFSLTLREYKAGDFSDCDCIILIAADGSFGAAASEEEVMRRMDKHGFSHVPVLEKGGIMNMMNSVAMTIIAMMFGGIMEGTHQLEVVVNQIKKLAKGPAGLVAVTEVTCVISNMTMPEQYISIVVPGRMYAEEYRKMGLHPAVLSSALEGAGTVTSALIPWNTCGVYISDTLGIGVAQYGIFAIFNWLMPIINWLCAALGLTLKDLDNKPYKRQKAVKA